MTGHPAVGPNSIWGQVLRGRVVPFGVLVNRGHKIVEVAAEVAPHVGGFPVGARVLDHLPGRQDAGPDLAAPG